MHTDELNRHFDVVIVGGGAVGVALALSLLRLDYRVAVIELHSPSFVSSDPERVVALNYGSRCYLQGLGVWSHIAALGLGDIRHIVVNEPGNVGQAHLDVKDGQRQAADLQELGYVVEMGHLLEPMYQALRDSEATLFTPATVLDYDVQVDQVTITLQHGDEALGIETFVITAALLVGADGTHSQIRQKAGIDTYGWDYNRFGLVASVACEHGHRDTAYECFRSSGPLAFLPLADGRYSIVWAATPAEAAQLLAMDDAAFISALQKAAGASTMQCLGNISSISKRASFPLELTIAKSFAKARLALIGNAAHTVHPVAGQGMNLGFRDVCTLEHVLAKAAEQQHAHCIDPGQSILMQAYAEQRRADVMEVAGFTESMLHLFASSVPGMKWLRGMGLQKLPQAPGLSALLVQQAAGIAQMSGNALAEAGVEQAAQAGFEDEGVEKEESEKENAEKEKTDMEKTA